MNEKDIRKYAALMKELELTGLEITENDRVVRLERSFPAAAGTVVLPTAPAASAAPEVQSTQSDAGLTPVRSPLVGVFYAAPAENADPFVRVGDSVKKGQTLCIVEAMKLMNEITAEEDGVIEQIAATNGQVVEYGTILFYIKR